MLIVCPKGTESCLRLKVTEAHFAWVLAFFRLPFLRPFRSDGKADPLFFTFYIFRTSYCWLGNFQRFQCHVFTDVSTSNKYYTPRSIRCTLKISSSASCKSSNPVASLRTYNPSLCRVLSYSLPFIAIINTFCHTFPFLSLFPFSRLLSSL